MKNYNETFQEYWNKRYGTEGKIWGEKPSISANHALEIFRKANAKSVLVPGSGYGRHTRFFSQAGFKVTGVDFSPVAVNIARQFDTLSEFYNGSVLDLPLENKIFDAIYGFNVLHLFNHIERALFLQGCERSLHKDGLMFFTVFSEQEVEFGKSFELEKNTFESRPGRPVHYFTEDDLRQHFTNYIIREMGIVEEPEDHDGKPHTHILRYICAGLRK